MMTKFTNKEWHVLGDGEVIIVTTNPPDKELKTHAICQMSGLREYADNLANARLIAAAPAMYEALVMLIESDGVLGWIKAQAALKLAAEKTQ